MRYETKDVARVAHEANRALQRVHGDPTIPVSVAFDDLGEEARASVIDGVEGVLSGHTPEESHENWLRFKAARGWVLGPVKDEERREHPLLVPYAELPERQRDKDAVFHAVVTALSS